eukprot:TRINITY_DN8302_c0_g1_i1.p1 TRINITY_DN8302_c0_g1~~TRINITY_DN8302_c0_g1_i1.p1  ORF type:complete len:291 (+),score=155.87 TRINITY_DN8302_c0_g1_i1:97-969(+)
MSENSNNCNCSEYCGFNKNILNGSVALITGGGSGICFEIARAFGLHGCKISLMGRRENILQIAREKLIKQGIDTIICQGDVRNFESCVSAVEKTVSHFGQLNILVNGAAGNFLCSAQDLSSNAFKTVIEIDLIGTFNMSKAAFSALIASKSSSILNISATLHYGATRYQIHAAAAKAGVDSLTRSLALEWSGFGIRVNGIAPGPIGDTEGMKRLSGGAEQGVADFVPLKRLGSTKDIANAALFYVCDSVSNFISGDIMVVDGGSWLATRPFVPEEVYAEISAQRKMRSKL